MTLDLDPDSQSAAEQAQNPRKARYWKNQIDSALARERKWRKRAERVVKRYEDERDGDQLDIRADEQSKINMLWSNTEVLKAALFANLGKPDVSRNFPKAGKDNKIARQAALILERAVASANDRYDPEDQIESAVVDHLLAGRGQCYLQLEVSISEEDEVEEVSNREEDREIAMHLDEQSAQIVHIPYDDWTHGSAKKWEEVPWVAFRHLMTRDDIADNWNPELAKNIPLNYMVPEGKAYSEKIDLDDFKRAELWEIWDKRSRCRIYIAEGYGFELERTDDPFRLSGFFPCPRPLYGVKTPGNLVPRPEYLQYQDLCEQLDRINQRIDRMVEAMKVCGVYDASNDDDDGLKNLGMLDDGQFIPFRNFKRLAEGGGLAAAFQVRDTKPYAEAIVVLAQRGQEIIQLIYEVTGISDVVRGATDPRETASAQQLKARFGTQRLQQRQKSVQRFVGELFRLKAELIAEHFQPQQLSEMSGLDIPTEADKVQARQILMMAQQQAQMAAALQAQQQQAAQAAQQQQQLGGPPPPGAGQRPTLPQGALPAPLQPSQQAPMQTHPQQMAV